MEGKKVKAVQCKDSRESLADLCRAAYSIRKRALKMAYKAGKAGSHVGGSFSCLEILTVLYGKVLKYDLFDRKWNERDRFLASKAHCILTHYSALAEFGFIDESNLESFQEDNGLLAGHPADLEMGLEFSGGSLGMGLSIGVGMALAAKERKERHRVYVLLGDGECNEGSVWEAFMAAVQFRLDNLIAVIDYNHMQFDGTNEEVMSLHPLDRKIEAFGWKTVLCNGHEIGELLQAFGTEHDGMPLAVIAHTVKARGIKKYENRPESHHCVLTEEDYKAALADMEDGNDRN